MLVTDDFDDHDDHDGRDDHDDWFERALAEVDEGDDPDDPDDSDLFEEEWDDEAEAAPDSDPNSSPPDPSPPSEGPFEPEPHIVDEAVGEGEGEGAGKRSDSDSSDGDAIGDESLEPIADPDPDPNLNSNANVNAEPTFDPAQVEPDLEPNQADPDLEPDPPSESDEGDEGDDDSPLFDQSFGDALENAAVPDVGDESDGASQMAGGMQEPGSGADTGTGAAVDFGFGGPGSDDFDDEPDSDLPRTELGVEGLDRMIRGGVPERSLMVAIGSAGTGKTTLGLQFLDRGLADGERAVYITLEESRQRVIDSATEKGMPFDRYVDEGSLAIVDLDPVEMANSLASIRNELPQLVEEFGATRLVLDSVSLLEMMYENRAKRRNEVYDFTKGLKEAGVTALLTSEAAEENPYASRHGIVEYLTDAVFVMQYVRPDDFRETRLAIEIQKIRDANHSREKKPYEITDDGISVYQQANLF
ncbi:KaiC domain-containing protein [Halobiforma lacisalsi AJ5]|uniref:Circadian clock protein KaiC n=1 Tax=Natronobacterium lacisalsi AJ5 TaxID=358396 RepID=M0LG52_NATLA|nr:KaiC domain-containing protein [Halobiforma lacisalsi AJ5]EMA32048.1 circadian clock protein KaiC [Halobiforma lacisalsi AJ5]